MHQALFEGDHPCVAASLLNVGGVYFDLSKYDAALSYYTQALTMFKALFAADHPHLLLSLQGVENTQKQLAKQQSRSFRGLRLPCWLRR